jgi:hypothetical protein
MPKTLRGTIIKSPVRHVSPVKFKNMGATPPYPPIDARAPFNLLPFLSHKYTHANGSYVYLCILTLVTEMELWHNERSKFKQSLVLQESFTPSESVMGEVNFSPRSTLGFPSAHNVAGGLGWDKMRSTLEPVKSREVQLICATFVLACRCAEQYPSMLAQETLRRELPPSGCLVYTIRIYNKVQCALLKNHERTVSAVS